MRAVGAARSRDLGRAPGRRAPRSRLLLGLLALVCLALLVLAFLPLPYVIMGPGPATNTLGTTADGKPLISVPKDKDHPASGVLSFTTVSVRGGPGGTVTAYDLLGAWAAGHRAIVPEEQVFPRGMTGEDVKRENAAEMSLSQEDAIVVAQRALGMTVPETVTVGAVPQGSPAAGKLQVGDRLLRIGDRPVTGSVMLRSAIQSYAEGQSVPLAVGRAGAEQQVSVPVRVVDGRKLVGVGLKVAYALPVKVTIDAGDVGGPSAGLMFSLGVYDRLTPGELTGGQRIAGTGTMAPDGTVGPIGGIQQKLVGARSAGAQWFLAPAGNCSEVTGHVPDGLRVVRVQSFQQALKDVEQIAAGTASALPTCS
ncbi:YlbL family protein [Arsenicicoccus sp. oral taxon 190]|uniref:YlbL family protein n=1 Tax=Arsenicicoccus sp. oral taxon 190 TaxID=1658671 RepID=UPI000679F9E7|nr:PDZ domain-containing protein [Arsenicicoccus sp. oral taxon 190]AKT51406.1 hypothetical protein ADJ73_08880 [Arsenicicoccus sp. oral taxon 190]